MIQFTSENIANYSIESTSIPRPTPNLFSLPTFGMILCQWKIVGKLPNSMSKIYIQFEYFLFELDFNAN